MKHLHHVAISTSPVYYPVLKCTTVESRKMRGCSKYWLTIFAIAFTLVTNVVCNSKPHQNKREDKDLTQNILDYVNATQVRQFLLDLTANPHLAGTANNLATYVHDVWVQQGLDVVKYYSYDALLSFPDWDNPNEVNIINNTTNEVIFAASGRQKPLHSQEEFDATVVPNFNAYSKSGRIKGELVYAHYGEESDFQWLMAQGIDLKDKIVIARYGAIYRGDKVSFAEKYGAAGVILYPDPQDFAQNGRNNVYPNSTYLPGTGTQLGTLLMPYGDPMTPDYPSVDGAYRIPIADAYLPKIICQPIGYDDAEEFLKILGGISSPPEWIGSLNAAYNVGPGFIDSNLKVELDVRTTDQIKPVINVIGVIWGTVEPDRYVIIGNHRDAWVFGGLDPSSGTSAMLEVSRVFKQLITEGWQPRRTIIFASWDGEEYGLVGSQEWVEDNLKIIKDRTVAYINVDTAVDGTLTLWAEGQPTLHRVLYDAAKKIPNPNPEEISQGRETIYDTWVYNSPEMNSPIFNQTVPEINVPGAGSDFAPFLLIGGVPILDLFHVGERESPLYHTLYETFYDADVLVDPGFKFHAAMTQLWAEITRILVDAPILPLNVEDYAYFLQDAYQDIETNFGLLLNAQNISLSYFKTAIEKFAATSKTFQQHLASIDLADTIAVRAANDKLMQVERAFLQPEGLLGKNRSNLKHVVFAPSTLNQYGGSVFASLTDLVVTATTTDDWELVKRELAAVVHFTNAAASVLVNF